MKAKLLVIALMLAAMGCTVLHAQTATPTFNYADGTYAMPKSITVSDSTSGATISWCYIASGTCTPNTTYTAAIYVNPTTSETICANATASSVTSAMACAVYRNSTATATSTPTIGLASGTYTFPQTTTITDSGATILWCSTTGTSCTPGTAYSSSITISAAETICADGLASGDSTSATVCNTYSATTGGSTITGAGTTNYIPLFTGAATVGNSPIATSGSNVGIGTTSPGAPLQINSSEGLIVGNPSYNYSNYATDEAIFAGNIALQNMSGANYVGIEFKGANQPSSGSLFVGLNPNVGGTGGELQILNGSGQPFVAFENSGNVGIGTTTPSTQLEVNGSVKLTSGSGGSITFADGTIQSSAYTGVACGGDYAESVDVNGSRTDYKPGDVLVIDPNDPGKFLKSNEAYSTLVTGIYSTKPGYVGRRQTTAKNPDEVPMAMVGIVPTKVSAENGPIRAGDLLVSSSTLGYAMKGTDRSKILGAVIGKALGNLESGTGVIEVVVTLQ